jgi:hypothetical protein
MFCAQRRRLFRGPLVAFWFGPCFCGVSAALDFVALTERGRALRPVSGLAGANVANGGPLITGNKLIRCFEPAPAPLFELAPPKLKS